LLFNTIDFAIFFAIVFTISWTLARYLKGWGRIIFLLVASYYFYAHWNWRYLPLIFVSSTVDFYLGKAVAVATGKPAHQRKRLLIITVVLNLGLLAVFKYWNFGLENARWVWSVMSGQGLPAPSESLKVLLPPVGISFFTFVSMSYVIDCYRGTLKPHDSYFRYLLFVALFPHLVAGPIVRGDLLPQLAAPPKLTRAEGGEALFLIAAGLIKKVVISDQLAVNLVDRVFTFPQEFSSVEVLAGIYAYAVQIYCDFSGYSDIAIGCALLLGVRFPINFSSPYKATNLADFWRRWHISLSSWLRDYLYIPLGGNRGGPWATYRNLMLTMLLGGLWHGASWTFVFWGFLHGLGLGVTRAFQRRFQRGRRKDAPKTLGDGVWHVIAVLLTFHYVCLAWVFFRSPTFSGAMQVLEQLTTFTTQHQNLPPLLLGLLVIGLVVHYTPVKSYNALRESFIRLPAPAQGGLLFGVAVLLHEAAGSAEVPFIYFQF